jgi:hypothetical protein
LIFLYFNFRAHLPAQITPEGYIRSAVIFFEFSIVESTIHGWHFFDLGDFTYKVESPQKRLWNPYFKTCIKQSIRIQKRLLIAHFEEDK